jgi:two-component system chemotaxis response regulator CheB
MYTVLVIDSSVTMRNSLKSIINSMENFRVIDTALDPYDAREKIKLHEPDLVTLDIRMPRMDGFAFLKNLMRLHPMPSVVIASKDDGSLDDVLEHKALGLIQKPDNTEANESMILEIKKLFSKIIPDLVSYQRIKPNKIVTSKKSENRLDVLNERRIQPDEVLKSNPAVFKGDKIIGIGSSTGGVESLLKVFESLPSDLPPIVITQHIPYGFSTSFAARLNEHSQVDVCEVACDTILQKGHAYLAPGNMHLVISKDGKDYIGKLLDGQKVSRHKPSVDIMFRSLNNSAGAGTMAIMMTGMGDDGKIAIKELYDNGAYTVAQNEESCVVFGMPQQAIKANAIKDIVHLDNIAQYIIDFALGRRG